VTHNNVKYVRFQPLTFAANNFVTNMFERLCGNSIKVTFAVPFTVSTSTSGRNYKLSFVFGSGYTDAALGSGLS